MVGGLIDEGKTGLPREQRGQQDLDPLPARESLKGPVEGPLVHLQHRELPADFPKGKLRLQFLQNGQCLPLGMVHRRREAGAVRSPGDGPSAVQPPGEQAQKGRFPSAIPAHHPQPPPAVQPEVQIFKNIAAAALIGKGQIVKFNLCHGASPQTEKWAQEGNSRTHYAQKGIKIGKRRPITFLPEAQHTCGPTGRLRRTSRT